MTEREPSRRTVLRVAAGLAGAAAVGGTGMAVAGSTTETAAEGAPSVEWRRSYHGEDREYQLDRLDGLLQTADGGYVLSGDGAPVHETGPEREQFLLVRTDADGTQQWVAFARPDRESTRHNTTGLVATSDGGYGLVGNLVQRTPDRTAESVTVGAAAKVTDAGESDWTASVDALEEGEPARDAGFADAAPTDDGGFVAAGYDEATALCVRFAADGSVVWERRYEEYTNVHQAFAHDGGYLLFCGNGDRPVALLVDEQGAVQSATPLDVDLERTPYNHVFVPTADGGYAYTGRDQGHENMVLGRLSGSGERQWREEYDGPYQGKDWAFDILQTEDGGYALGGYMSEAYSGDSVPALVKAGPDGTHQWQKLLGEEAAATSYDTLIQTDDGGYACQIENTLVKLSPGSTESTPTRTPTETPPTETPADPATEAPTETDGEPTPEQSDPGTETETDRPTEPATETPAGGDADGSDSPGTEAPTDAGTETGRESSSGDDDSGSLFGEVDSEGGECDL